LRKAFGTSYYIALRLKAQARAIRAQNRRAARVAAYVSLYCSCRSPCTTRRAFYLRRYLSLLNLWVKTYIKGTASSIYKTVISGLAKVPLFQQSLNSVQAAAVNCFLCE
jgi:hypothetical protein